MIIEEFKSEEDMRRNKYMNELEMKEILEAQFKLLHERSKRCEPEYLESLTNAMLNIITTLKSFDQYYLK